MVVEERHWLVIIAASEQKIQRAVVEGSNFWTGDDVCCGYLVGIYAGLGYLCQYQFQLRTPMPPIGVPGCICPEEG